MFDTVLFRRVCNEPRLDRFSSVGDKFVFNPPPVKGHALPHLTWRRAPDGIGYLDACVSLPKMLFGNNVQMISDRDIPRVQDIVSDFATDVVGVKYNAWTANIGRFDIGYNWRVGETETYMYLRALQNAHLPRMVRRVIDTSTVDFTNNSQKVVIYSKHAETMKLAQRGKATDEHLRESIGVLRIEHRFINTPACRRVASRMKLDSHRAEHVLRSGIAETIMEKTIMELGLNNRIESGDSRLELLLEHYGFSTIYEKLAGFLQLCDKHGADNLVRLGCYSQETFLRRRELAKSAGVWLTNPTRAQLPPLRLVRSSAAPTKVSVGNE